MHIRKSHPLAVPALVLVLLAPSILAADRPADFRAIEAEFRSGRISRTEMLYQKMNLFFSASDLAAGEKVNADRLEKSGTGFILDALENWNEFSPSQQAVMAAYLARPGKQCAYDSPAGFFKIHYDTIGSEAVPAQDQDVNGIPDYVDRIALYADSSRSAYVSGLGFIPPPDDHGSGGDNKYDIYLLSISGYGATVPESAGDSAWNDYSSYIMIHRNLYGFSGNDDPAGDTIGAQKVTCAHEFFHAVQLAYDRFESLWWMEEGATRMEDYVFPEVNDNYNYLPFFYDVPEIGLQSTDNFHDYASFVWPLYMDQKLDIAIHRKIWEYCRYYQDVAAIDSGIAGYGVTVSGLFPEFAKWNHYTGTKVIAGKYFPDASSYPEAGIDLSFETLVHEAITPINEPQGLACNYIELTVDSTARGVLALRLTGSEFVAWAMTAIIHGSAGDTAITRRAVLGNPIEIYLPYIEDYTLVTVIPTVVSAINNGNDYTLDVSLYSYGDANKDRTINIGDATYIINYVFRGGPTPTPVKESGDANCDGKINVADAITIVNYVFRGGPAPCAGR